MNIYIAPIGVALLVSLGMIIGNEKYGLLRCDEFASRAAKLFAYAWLTLFLLILGLATTFASTHLPTPAQLAQTPFYALFELHVIFVIFLLGWWLATRRPPLTRFFNIQREKVGEAVLTGFAVGLGGWIFTIVAILLIAVILKGLGLVPGKLEPSPMIAFLAKVAWWKKALIVCSAMTVEEALFRGFFQKRIGLIASTILFALAHTGLGQPFLLIGVTIISLVIGFTFYRTKNLIPGVIAHGVFDAVQIFVIIPIAFRVTGMG
jgi:membrane protease YdiL (CAAX protease family)